MTDRSTKLPGDVVVRAVDVGGGIDEWAVFVRGNYIESFAARDEAERVAWRISIEEWDAIEDEADRG